MGNVKNNTNPNNSPPQAKVFYQQKTHGNADGKSDYVNYYGNFDFIYSSPHRPESNAHAHRGAIKEKACHIFDTWSKACPIKYTKNKRSGDNGANRQNNGKKEGIQGGSRKVFQ